MIEDLLDLPVEEGGLRLPAVAQATHAELREHQGDLTCEVLKPGKIGAKVPAPMQIDVERTHIHEGELEVFRRGKVGVRD